MPYMPRTELENSVVHEAKELLQYVKGWSEPICHKHLQRRCMTEHLTLVEVAMLVIREVIRDLEKQHENEEASDLEI